ncbi:SPOR domain-containing protein [Vibrio sp. WXL103]|uniref:SPOR domain-containing protein n=1 Tax=unclassified Vibrio TaxID=2614977 RepID=UPI003EC6325F
MKKMLVVGLSSLVAACTSNTYVTDVKSESYVEDYTLTKEAAIVEVEAQSTQTSITKTEETVVETKLERVVKPVLVTPPSDEQEQKQTRYGYTIQVAAMSNQAKVDSLLKAFTDSTQPVWQNDKVVDGVKWHTVLYGDYATRKEAANAITVLPEQVRRLKPFVKSIDAIKNSQYPELNKLK